MAAPGARSGMDKQRSDALQAMDLVKIVRAYVQAMVDETSGYKALLLDKETMRIVSTLYGRTELAEHSVVHIERIDTHSGGAGGDGAPGQEHPELKVRRRRGAAAGHGARGWGAPGAPGRGTSRVRVRARARARAHAPAADSSARRRPPPAAAPAGGRVCASDARKRDAAEARDEGAAVPVVPPL
jgi:hypothetical protein